jgi:hypothetical protein
MKTFIIYPVHKRGYKAPGIAIVSTEYSVAVELARKSSRLSDFPEWRFM